MTARLSGLWSLILTAALALASAQGLAADPDPDSQSQSGIDPVAAHRLGAGDKVRIQVFGEDDLSVSERVSDRGTIAYPLLGELQVADLTTAELAQLIDSRLRGPYLVDPRVTVSIEEYREFYIMGQVNRPGAYPYVPGLTIRKAISVAGGYTDRASRSKVFVVSEAEPGKERRVDPESAVSPGDSIVVKESFF